MDTDPVLLEVRDGVAHVTLNRPETGNALDIPVSRALLGRLRQVAADETARVVLLTGQGRAFCAGGDLKERHGMTDDDWRAQHAIIEEGAYALLNCSVPVLHMLCCPRLFTPTNLTHLLPAHSHSKHLKYSRLQP